MGTYGSPFEWQWFSPGGVFLGDADSILAGDAGQYSLVVTNSSPDIICRDTAVAFLFADTLLPSITLVGDTLTCWNNITGQLGTFGSLTDTRLSWTGPGNFSSSESAPLVYAPGTYILLAEDSLNYCTSLDSVVVAADTVSPDIVAQGGILTCSQPVSWLSGSSSTSGVTFSWTGPGSFMASIPDLPVSEAGTYTLLLTAPNGCTSMDTALITAYQTRPSVDISTPSGSTLTCLKNTLDIVAVTGDSGLSFMWSDGQGLISTQQHLTVSQPGIYVLLSTGPNGCTDMDSVIILADNLPPFVSASGGLLTCAQPSITLAGNSANAVSQWQWSNTQGVLSNFQNLTVNSPGTYTLMVTAMNGCTATDTAIVTQSADFPDLLPQGGTLTCASGSVQLLAQSSFTDLQWLWTGPGLFTSSQQMPVVTLAGLYTVVATSPSSGCTSTAQVVVLQDIVPPSITATGGMLTCSVLSTQLSAQSSLTDLQWFWTGPGGFTSDQPMPVVGVSGQYTVLATRLSNGCTTTAQVVVLQDIVPPSITVAGGTLTCSVLSTQLSAQSSFTDLQWFWTGPGGFSSALQMPVVTVPGQYTVIATLTSNGCSVLAPVTVTDQLEIPVAVSSADSVSLTCLNDSVSVSVQLQTTAVLSWLTPQGIAGDLTSLTAITPGYYIWTATGSGGCFLRDTIVVLNGINPVTSAQITIRPAPCFGQAEAGITIEKVEGGSEPVLFSLDNQLPGAERQWNGLQSGLHALRIRESGGCVWDTVLAITEPLNWQVSLSPDTTVFRGETVLLQIQTDLSPMSLKQVQWSPPISCDTCLQYFTSVYFDQLFVATVSDHAGCENSDEVFIKVNQRRNVFIPNVFSPNADGENDKFQIFADYDLERISLFRVFDRWGELLYEERDALPGNNQGWDGSFRGQMMPPGVYAWMAVLTFKGGATEQYAGDLTVLR